MSDLEPAEWEVATEFTPDEQHAINNLHDALAADGSRDALEARIAGLQTQLDEANAELDVVNAVDSLEVAQQAVEAVSPEVTPEPDPAPVVDPPVVEPPVVDPPVEAPVDPTPPAPVDPPVVEPPAPVDPPVDPPVAPPVDPTPPVDPSPVEAPVDPPVVEAPVDPAPVETPPVDPDAAETHDTGKSTDLNAVDAVAALASYTDVESINAYTQGDDRKTVQDAAQKKIASLT